MEIRSITDEWDKRPKELNAALEEASTKGQHKQLPLDFDNVPSYEKLMEWIETDIADLTDEQKRVVEHYWNYANAHTDMPIKPRNPVNVVEKMLQMAALEAEVEAKKRTEAPKVHAMHYDSHGSKGAGVYCTCGQYKHHSRGKVLAAWADRHHTKTGHLWAGQDGSLR